MAGKVIGDKKFEEYENEKHYLLWWSDNGGTFLIVASVSRTDNFVNMNVFNSDTSPRVLSYRCVLHYFSTMTLNFNLTFGLKPQVGGIKIATF